MFVIQGSNSEVDKVYSLLNLISDPKGHAKRLKEIEEQTKLLETQVENLRLEYSKKKSLEDYALEVEKIKAEYISRAEGIERANKNYLEAKTKLEQDRLDLDNTSKRYAEIFTNKKNELDKRETELSIKESKVRDNLEQTKFEANQARIIKIELDGRLNKLKEAMV